MYFIVKTFCKNNLVSQNGVKIQKSHGYSILSLQTCENINSYKNKAVIITLINDFAKEMWNQLMLACWGKREEKH